MFVENLAEVAGENRSSDNIEHIPRYSKPSLSLLTNYRADSRPSHECAIR